MTGRLEDRIRDHIARSAALERPPGDHEALVELGFVASLRMLELVAFLEDELGIAVRPVDLAPDRLATVARIAEMVRSRLRSTAR